MRKVLQVLAIVFLCLLIYTAGKLSIQKLQSTTPKHTQQTLLQLTTKEQEWLKNHQPIRIAFDGQFPPYSFIDESGKLAGISYDIIRLISQRLGITLKIDARTTWKDIYSAAREKKIDAVATMVKRPDRKKYFVFTDPYIFKSLVIVSNKNNKQIKNRGDLPGKTVALVRDYQYVRRILNEFPSIIPYYVDNMRNALTAVETEKADAAISFFAASYYYQEKYLLSNIQFVAFYDRNSSNESIAVRGDWPILAAIFQKGMNSLTEAEKQAVVNKWHPLPAFPVDYGLIGRIVIVFSGILLLLLLWLKVVRRHNQRIQATQEQLLKTNKELEDLRSSLEVQVQHRTAQLKKSEQKYRSLVENLQDEYFFYQHDLNGVFTYLSPSVTNILGYSVEEFLKHYSTYQTDHPDNAKIDDYTERCLHGEKTPAYEVEVFDTQGRKRSLEILETQLLDDQGQCIGIEGIAHDITSMRQTRERLNWLSFYDDLTGLANRRLFADRIEQLIALSHRHQESLTLLFLDLNRFKIINDGLGHASGDAVLKETADRIQKLLRESDVAARMGGDEFTLILPDTDAHAAEVVIKKLLQCFMKPYEVNCQQLILSCSIGVAIYPEDGADGDTLLQQADNAMYFAKTHTQNYAFCSSDLCEKTSRRLLLEQALRKALAKDCYDENFQLQVFYQSKNIIQNKQIVGYEALMRWRHPDLGMIPPAEFIPLAEKTGLIADLSRWVLNRVCLQTLQWASKGYSFGKIAINISAVELVNSDLAKNIIAQIDATGAQRHWIEIEITESALMKNPDVAIIAMQQLVEAGVLIAIDDFGTGYSSLSYLKNIPATYIKIDQSFIRNLLHSPEDQTVVEAVIAMSHALGKKVIAEGVETGEQLQFLAENGCDIAQGYWFSKPVPQTELHL